MCIYIYVYIYIYVKVYVLLSQSGLKTGLSLPPSQAAKQPQVFLFFFVFVQSVVFFCFRLVLLVFVVFNVFRWSELLRNNPGPLSPVSCFG